jgi:hypothetical protein
VQKLSVSVYNSLSVDGVSFLFEMIVGEWGSGSCCGRSR